jgi:hypothetical protein
VAWRKNDPNLTNNPSYLEPRLTQAENEIGILSNELSKQNKQSTSIGHGLNIINASQNSPLDIQIEGRTLVNVSQNVLDSAKYYVLADKKSKVKFADGTTYTGVAKFQGKAEKPILIRIADFEGKVAGSTVENPHVVKWNTANQLLAPNASWNELTNTAGPTDYGRLKTIDGVNVNIANSVNGNMSQTLVSFNLIEEIERKVGKIPANDTAGKVAWLKNNIAKLTYNGWHYGQSPSGYKASILMWIVDSNQWSSTPVTHTNPSVTKISLVATTLTDKIDSNGFVHFIAYAEPSDGVTASAIYTDRTELEIELKPEAQLWNPRLPLYEVDATEYANILTTWDETEVMRRYPAVESVQHVQNPYVIAEGENLLPPFNEWNLHANAVVREPYKLELNATAVGQYSYVQLKVIKGQTYTLNVQGNGKVAVYRVVNGTQGTSIIPYTSSPITATFTPDTDEIRVFVSNDTIATGTFTFSNPMLTIGSTSKPFVPRNPSMLLIDGVKLGALSDKKDILWKDGQDWKVTKWIEKDIVLDGKLAWAFNTDYTGFKRVNYAGLTGTVSNNIDNTFVLTKYDGKKISYYGTEFDKADEAYCFNNIVSVTISDTDSGWGETYTPTTAEIQAYFYGWRMCNGTYSQPYDGTGTKTWYPIGDMDLSRATTTCPTSAAPTISEGKIGYYKLSYVRSTPVTEIVTDKVEGDLVVNGATQVEVGSGVVIREKITPRQHSTSLNWYINEQGLTPSVQDCPLSKRVSRILNIYRNGVVDSKWTRNTSTSNQNGTVYASIQNSDYDPTAEYTVTYLVLDRHLFTTNILAVTATYDSSLKSVVDSVVAKQSDLASNQQALIRSVAELYKRVKALGG